MIFGLNEKSIILTHIVLLAIPTNMTDFVIAYSMCSINITLIKMMMGFQYLYIVTALFGLPLPSLSNLIS